MAEYKVQSAAYQKKMTKYVAPEEFRKQLKEISKAVMVVHEIGTKVAAALATDKKANSVTIERVGTFSKKDVNAMATSVRKHIDSLRKVAAFIKPPRQTGDSANNKLKDPYFISDQFKGFIIESGIPSQVPALGRLLNDNIITSPLATSVISLYVHMRGLKVGAHFKPDDTMTKWFGSQPTSYVIGGVQLTQQVEGANDAKRTKIANYNRFSNLSAFQRLAGMTGKPGSKKGDGLPYFNNGLVKWIAVMPLHNFYRIPSEFLDGNRKLKLSASDLKSAISQAEVAISGTSIGGKKKQGGLIAGYKA